MLNNYPSFNKPKKYVISVFCLGDPPNIFQDPMNDNHFICDITRNNFDNCFEQFQNYAYLCDSTDSRTDSMFLELDEEQFVIFMLTYCPDGEMEAATS